MYPLMIRELIHNLNFPKRNTIISTLKRGHQLKKGVNMRADRWALIRKYTVDKGCKYEAGWGVK